MEGTDGSWRKSSLSSNGGANCVEVGHARDDNTIMVRDTKQHGRGQVHTFSAGQWRAFVESVKAIARLPTGRQR